jgi:outer membrane beta-barrel protein
LPSTKAERYRSALLRVTIALAVGFALVSRLAVAASPASSPPGPPAEENASPGEVERSSRPPGGGAPVPRVGKLPASPFAEPADAGGAARPGADADGDDSEGEVSDDAQGDGELPGAPLRALSCLEGEGGNDQDGARRGVQKRDFLKRLRVEISALGGYVSSDALSSTYIYGGALAFFPSEEFGVELLVTRNPVSFRLEEPFNTFDRERHFQPGVAWNVLGAMTWAPVHAKLRWSERNITHADILLSAGAGQTIHDSVQGLTFQAGLGIKLYLAKYFTLRLDVRDLMIPQEVLGRGRATHNIITLFGISTWVPG